jgi:penicillin-binding protein-related factor A (putative recombinase)
MKTCSTCKKEKELSDFPKKQSTKKDGRAAKCKDCQNEYLKNWREKDKLNYYLVYYLPEEHYVGITSQPEQRMQEHKSRAKRNINGWRVLFCSEDKYEACLIEAHYHCMGFNGLRTDINDCKI